MSHRSREGYIPRDIRKSRIVTALWLSPGAHRWLHWPRASWLARFLP